MRNGFYFLLLLAGFQYVSCSFTQKIKTGEQAYEFRQYSLAVQMLTEEYQQTPVERDKAHKAFLLGKSYERMNEPRNAADWFDTAWGHNFGEEALMSYAGQMRRTEDYAAAIEAYRQLLTIDQQSQRYRRMVTVCQQALEWKESELSNPYTVSELTINTPASEYAAILTGADEIIFSSDRPNSSGEEDYKWTGRRYSDLFYANVGVGSVELFDDNINTKHNEGLISLSSDQAEMFFVRCFSGREYDSYCKIMYSRYTGGGWTEPEILPFIKEGINYGSPWVASGDSVLYFSCNDPEGFGGYDIYRVMRQDDEWGTPEILSERINSIGDEKFPTLDKDTLYFSSDELVGMGGLDIFKTYPLGGNDWAPPENLKAPLNSGGDDFYLVVDSFAELRGDVVQTGYFTSSRPGGAGSDDLYSYEKIRRVPEEVVVEEDTPDTEEDPVKYQIFLAIKVVEPVFADPEDPNSERIGKKVLKEAQVTVNEGPLSRMFTTDTRGLVIFELDFDTEYQLIGRYPGHLASSKDFSTRSLNLQSEEPVKTYNLELVLDPIFKGKEIVLENIYYDFDQWFIREDAKPTLDTLTSMLKDNPEISIQLSSHTDCRGNDEYNAELSQKRAQSAVDYLISNGITSKRLTARGFGESQPSVECVCEQCDEDQHQANRRTAFAIID